MEFKGTLYTRIKFLRETFTYRAILFKVYSMGIIIYFCASFNNAILQLLDK